LRVEFPVLLANAAGWLTGAGALEIERETRTGHTLTVRAEGDRALVVRPDGGSDEVALASGSGAYARTDRVGLYRVEAGGRTVEVGASLLEAAESSIAPRDLQTAGGVPGQVPAGDVQSEREVWPYLIAPLVLLLLLEWVLYHRRLAG
jgi:hypothetical protein